jgi:O-antigen ligase
VALLLTFSRSAWLGAAAAVIVLAAGGRGAAARLGVAGAAVLVAGVVLFASLSLVGGLSLERAVELRARTVFDTGTWQTSRLHIWQDSLSLVASRPLFGYGPDNFGLIFPTFQTGNWAPAPSGLAEPIDKAHAETLQVAATQGVVGLAAYAFMLVAFLRAFWRGRGQVGAVPILAAWLAYELTLQFNFSTPAASFPFWIFAAAAIVAWSAELSIKSVHVPRAPLAMGVGAASVAAFATLAWLSVFCPFIADDQLLQAVNSDFAGRPDMATERAWQARLFAPFESVYAVEAGNLAFEEADWARARAAFDDASRLGTYNPAVYRNLALADLHVGRNSEARAAAQRAVDLDRFDPANRALLAQFDN